MIRTLFEPLILTVILEAAVAYVLGVRDLKRQYLILLVNCITNPLLVCASLLAMHFMGVQSGTMITYVLFEPIVVIAEYLMYQKKMDAPMHPLIFSALLNMISICGGVLWRSLF